MPTPPGPSARLKRSHSWGLPFSAALIRVGTGVATAVVTCAAVGVALDILGEELPQQKQEGLETIIGLIAVSMLVAGRDELCDLRCLLWPKLGGRAFYCAVGRVSRSPGQPPENPAERADSVQDSRGQPHRRSLRVVLVTMWNRVALSADSRKARPARSLQLFSWALVISVVLASTATSSSLATRVPAKLPRIPGTVLACFHKKTHRFTAEIEPDRCEFKGTEGKQRKPLRLSVKGLQWNFWGTFSSRGSLGNEIPSGIHVRVFVFRRVECRDGRVWYSSAVVFNTNNGHYSVLRLPACEALS